MTSETVISLSSRLWDVIVASFVGDYPTAEAVQRAFPNLRSYHDLEVWGGLDRQGSESRMRTLVPVDDVRAELTALANRGESCALHVEVVAPHGMPPPLSSAGWGDVFMGTSFSRGLFCLDRDGVRTILCAVFTYDLTYEHTPPHPGAPLFTKQSVSALGAGPAWLGLGGGGDVDLAMALRIYSSLLVVSRVRDV
jgi:hypothetical protein